MTSVLTARSFSAPPNAAAASFTSCCSGVGLAHALNITAVNSARNRLTCHVGPPAAIILLPVLNDLFSVFASDLLPIFVIAGAGFALARWLNASATTLTHVVFYALLPCFSFRLLIATVATGRQFGRMVLLAVLVVLAMAAVGALVSLMLRLSRTESTVFLLVVMFSNGGNYGLPVVSFAFGEEALSYGTVFFLTGSVLTNTVGAFLAAAGRKSLHKAAMSVLRMPAIYAIAAAMFVLATGISVPTALLRPITMMSDAALPVMILVLGMQLERARLAKAPRPCRRSRVCVAARGPARRARPHVAAARDGPRPPGGCRALLHAGGRRDDDSRARVRCLAGLRHERSVSLDDPQPADADAADRVSAVT